jgi:O-antigen ligase
MVLSLPRNSATWIFAWPQVLMVPVLVFLLASSGVLLAVIGRQQPGFSMVWLVGILSLVASATLSFLIRAVPPNTVLPCLLLIGGCLCFLVISLLIWQQEGGARRVGIAIGLIGGGIVTVSLYRWSLQDIPTAIGLLDPLNAMAGERLLDFSFEENRNDGPFGHRNYVAGLVLLVLPWHLYLTLTTVSRLKLVWLAFFLLDAACLMTTMSRGAVIGLAVGAGVFVAWLAASKLVSRKLVLRIVIATLVFGGLFTVFNPRLRSSVARMVNEGSTQTDSVRASMVHAGWLIFADHPWLGVGPGSATVAYPRYRSQPPAALEDNYQLHVTPLQVAAEQGLFGMVAWGILAWAALRSFRSLNSAGKPEGAAAFFSLVTYGVFAFTDYQLDVLPIGFLVFSNLAVLAALDKRREPRRRAVQLGSIILASSVSLLVAAFSISEFKARATFASGVEGLRSGDTEAFASLSAEAARLAPFPQYFLTQLGAFHAEQWANTTNAIEKTRYLNAARAQFAKSLQIDAAQEICHFNMGWMLQDSDSARSAGHFVKSARLVPDRKGVYRGLALSLLDMGQTNAAVECLALECLANPLFVSGAFWVHGDHGDLQDATHHALTNDLARAADEQREAGEHHQSLANRIAVIHWRRTGEVPELDEARWSDSMLEFWRAVASNSREPIRKGSNKGAWEYLHDAWADEQQREALVKKALILARELPPSDSVTQRLVDWLDQDQWAGVVRNDPPPELFRAYGRRRTGVNLMARNMDGIKPTDVCAYVDNYVAELFFEFLYGRKDQVSSVFVLKRLDEIIDGVPELEALIHESTPPGDKP